MICTESSATQQFERRLSLARLLVAIAAFAAGGAHAQKQQCDAVYYGQEITARGTLRIGYMDQPGGGPMLPVMQLNLDRPLTFGSKDPKDTWKYDCLPGFQVFSADPALQKQLLSNSGNRGAQVPIVTVTGIVSKKDDKVHWHFRPIVMKAQALKVEAERRVVK
jgi:hypothetical protein